MLLLGLEVIRCGRGQLTNLTIHCRVQWPDCFSAELTGGLSDSVTKAIKESQKTLTSCSEPSIPPTEVESSRGTFYSAILEGKLS